MVILGNGFDVALGFPTRYSQFYSNSKELRDYAAKGNTLCQHILDNIKFDLWSDLEEGLYHYSLAITNEYGVGNKEQAEKLKREFNELRDALYIYLNSVAEIPVLIEKQANVIGLNVEWHELNPQYLTFNYSINTAITADMNVRYILNGDDSINELRFIYQHSSIFDTKSGKNHPSNDIVVGIDPNVQSVETAHSFLYKSEQKLHNLDSTIKYIKEKDFYIVYGCSIGDSDATYFKEVFSKNQKGKIFLIYGYGPDAIDSIKANIERICCVSIDELTTNNFVEFLDVKRPGDTRNATRQVIQEYLKSSGFIGQV